MYLVIKRRPIRIGKLFIYFFQNIWYEIHIIGEKVTLNIHFWIRKYWWIRDIFSILAVICIFLRGKCILFSKVLNNMELYNLNFNYLNSILIKVCFFVVIIFILNDSLLEKESILPIGFKYLIKKNYIIGGNLTQYFFLKLRISMKFDTIFNVRVIVYHFFTWKIFSIFKSV